MDDIRGYLVREIDEQGVAQAGLQLADAQRKAMFANGYKGESLEESVEDDYMNQADADARKVKSLYRKNKDIDSVFSSLGYTNNGDGSYEKEVEDNIFIVFEYDEDFGRLEYNVVNEETRTGTPSNVLNLSKKLKERVQRIDEDWEPDKWEETDFLDDEGKKVYINIIKEAEDIDDLKDIAHDLYWHDKGLFAMLRNFPKDKSFEWIQNRMIEVIKSTMNESLTEASYGGAYDIEDDMFWTKDDLIEFSDAVCEKLADKFGYQYDIADVGAESNNDMYITIMDTTHDIEADVSFRIKMSRIRSPRDLMKYLDTVVSQFVKKFEEEYQYYDFDESLKEQVNLPGYAVKYTTGYSGNGVNSSKTEWFRTEEERDRRVKELKDKNYIEIKTWKMDNFYHTIPKNESLNEDMSKPDFVVGFYAGPVDDESLELVNPNKILQVDVSADELRARYGKTVDKLLNDYTSQTVDKLKNGNSTLKAMILNFAEKKARETGELDDKFRNEERKFLDTGIYMDSKLEEINYPFEDGIKKLSKQLGKMLLPKRENLKEDMSAVMDDFAYARRNWDRIGTGVSLDDALEEYNAQYGQEGFYARPLYSESEWNKMVNMFADVETMTEAVDDEVDFDTETDFDDDGVEKGNVFIEDGKEWVWVERIAGPIHLDFDNWAVWEAREFVSAGDFIIKTNEDDTNEIDIDAFEKAYYAAEKAYFVVDEDTGFVDWGPCETQTEAQDFLNGKVEDWENDEYDESLKESKQLKESSDITDNGHSYILHYEDIGNGKEYDYEVSSDEMFDFLNITSWENGDGPEDIDMEDHEQWDNWVADNIDELLKKYEDDILDHFREDASQEEYDNRDPDDRGYDPYEEIGMKPSDF